MTAFDSEPYLWQLAERTLANRADEMPSNARSPLLSAAQALVAAGRVEEAAAQRVLDAHDEERRRRDPERAVGWKRQWPQAPFARRRVALGDGVVGHPAGALDVRYVVFARDVTRIAVSIRRSRRPRLTHAQRIPFGIGARAHVRVAGERGEPVFAGFSGTGSDRRWEGVLESLEPLDETTRWVEIDGLRVQLADTSPAVEVRVQALPDADAALRHLWQCTALTSVFYDPFLEPAINALIAAGAVSPDDPQLTSLRAVATALALDGRQRRTAAAKLPEPWSSLWRPRDWEGPAGTIAVGAVTPMVDGVAVAVDALESSPQQWSIAVELTPEGAGPHPFEAPTARMARLVWWADDDRQNHYLAEAHGIGGNAQGGRGRLTFDAPLDPRARWIELRPTTETARAVIRIPLNWRQSG